MTPHCWRHVVSKQARQESNPQPPVLETGALPIELLAFKLCGQIQILPDRTFSILVLLRLAVQSMLFAVPAVFIHFKTVRIISAVFL
jgi:hypothetical protein